MKIEIELCGIQKAPYNPDNIDRKRGIKSHFHDFYEILIFNDTESEVESVEYLVDNNIFSLRPGNVLIVPPYKYHTAFIQQNKPFKRIVVQLRADANDAFTQTLLSRLSFADTNSDHRLLLAVNRLTDYLEHFDKETLFHLIPAVVCELLVLMDLSSSESATLYRINPMVASLIEHINKNLHHRLTLNALAKRYSIHPKYLSKLFKDTVKAPLMGYIRTKQLLLAKSLIDGGEFPTQVYFRCGFEDYSGFYRAYKKFFGHSPSK